MAWSPSHDYLLGYGAAAKGNTLLNDAGIRADLLAAADRAPSKQGKLLPGSHIPVISPEQLPGTELVTAIPVLRRDSGAMMGKPDP